MTIKEQVYNKCIGCEKCKTLESTDKYCLVGCNDEICISEHNKPKGFYQCPICYTSYHRPVNERKIRKIQKCKNCQKNVVMRINENLP